MLSELEGRLKLLIQTTMRTVGTLEEMLSPNYPEWALRELLMNAVMHRDYASNSPIRFYNQYGIPISLKPGNTWIVITGVSSIFNQTQSGQWRLHFGL